MSGFLISAGIKTLGSLAGGIFAGSRARKARARARELQDELDLLEDNRQEIIDPTANVKDLSSLIENPYKNLQVATGAAEMQSQQADLSLATTLDTLRATGSGAGGATALAQAALRSKQGVAATIAKQEADNTRLRAQGEAKLQELRLKEGARVQGLKAQGQQFMFMARERREQQKLDRTSGLLAQQQGVARSLGNQAMGMYTSAIGSALGAVGYLAADEDHQDFLDTNFYDPNKV